jgi:hypothetical protein
MRYKTMSMTLGLLMRSSGSSGFFGERKACWRTIISTAGRGGSLLLAFQAPQSRKRHQSRKDSSSLISSTALQYSSVDTSDPTRGRRRLFSSSTTRLFSSSSAADTTATNKEQQQQHVFFETATTFTDLGIQSDVLKRRIPFACPTKVQAATIPSIKQGTDVTIGAETGSGKVC